MPEPFFVDRDEIKPNRRCFEIVFRKVLRDRLPKSIKLPCRDRLFWRDKRAGARPYLDKDNRLSIQSNEIDLGVLSVPTTRDEGVANPREVARCPILRLPSKLFARICHACGLRKAQTSAD